VESLRAAFLDLLYFCYIDDFSTIFQNLAVTCKLYAGDIKLYSCYTTNCRSGIHDLSDAIESLSAWSQTWQLHLVLCCKIYHIGWLTLNSATHNLDQFAQLLEDTHLDYTKYRAALMLQNIFLLTEFMIYEMNCQALLSILSLSLYLKSDCVVLICLLVCAILALFLCDFS
jgi:hypothetical protein